MMRLPSFQYFAPRTVAEALELKARYGPRAMYVAGGTDLYPKMKRRQFEPEVLIGLRGIAELHREPETEDDVNGRGATIGAGVTLSRLIANPLLRTHYPVLVRAARLVSSPQLRNAGTIGGNLCVDTRCTYYDQSYSWRKALGFCMKKDGDTCWVALSSRRCRAVSSSDCAPVAIALDAHVRLAGPEGERLIPVEALYRLDGKMPLAKSPDELLVSLELPPRSGWRMTYWKLRRRGSIDFPILGVAVAMKLAPDGVCTQAKLVLGAVASRPLVVEDAAELLVGAAITPEVAREAGRLAARHAKPMDNTDLTLSYRKKIARVYVEGAILEAAGLKKRNSAEAPQG